MICTPESLVASSTLPRGINFSGSSGTHAACGVLASSGSGLSGARVGLTGGDLLSAGHRASSVVVSEACAPSVPCPLPTEGGFSSCSGGRRKRVVVAAAVPVSASCPAPPPAAPSTESQAPASYCPEKNQLTTSASVTESYSSCQEGTLGSPGVLCVAVSVKNF
ncbi:Keratin, type II cuticular Hb4 [Tupaia chinensis]|uniref:Keratin, type II cuticular Hb4 n=1 Tax=Tupaia chinensis TaxID=246437 RepID=L8Y9Y9_TUPCH|nr:Keratin, type II cuticular Hb4 [Tupaia chinensis]